MTTGFEDAVAADDRARLTVKHETDRTLFVEAGAGTGKTTALVGRIVQLVLAPDVDDRVPLSEIAAITFTEAAAAELRERIRGEFEAALSDARRSGDDSTAAACETALADADLAAISTLHAFAQRLLAEHPVEVGIPPRVEVIDEVQSQIAFEDRWSEFVDALFNDTDIETFVVRASILNVRIGARNSPLRTIAKIFDDNWDRLEGIESTAPLAIPVDFTAVNEAIVRILAARSECADPDDKMLANIDKAAPLLERFLASRSETERLRMLARLSVSKNNGRAGNWPDLDAVKDDALAVAEAATSIHDAVANQTLQLLAARIAVFVRETANQRRAEGTLEFHDLLVLARTLLRTAPDARANLASRYRVLMLDEFQDTDPIQIELALLLAGSVSGPFTGDWSELHADDGRLFMVGDPKQSIYRFRRADIDLFLQVQKRFAAGRVDLTRNFRTVGPIIDAINGVFAERMTGDNAQASYSPLIPTRSGPVDHRPAVFGGPSNAKAGELRHAEATDVATIIAAIRDDPASWPVFDKRRGEWRNPKLQDITVLLPTRTSLRQLSDALDAERIPFRADTGTLVYETQEVRDLILTLRAVDDPSDQIALVAALRSPLYACGDDDLFRWREHGGTFDLRSGWPPELEDSPVAAALTHLRTLSDLRWWDEPSRLLQRLIDDRRAFVLPAGGRRPRDTWRRLRYLVDQARAFAESGGGDLRAWLKWTSLQGLDGSKAHEPMLPELDDDAVQIMTIHGSKGLEFPITIVSGLTTDLGRGHGAGVEVAWHAPGTIPEVAINAKLRTSKFDLANDLESEMARPEKDRLLYVALTRARDHLIVSTHHPLKTNGEPKDSHGATLHGFATESLEGLFRPALGQGTLFGSASADPVTAPAAASFRIPDGWQEARSAALERASATTVRSATALARAVRADLELDASDETSPMDEIDDDAALPPQTFRRGRAGTAIGSAVHAVLQYVDLSDPDPVSVAELVTAQAWAESVPEHEETIAAAVASALASDVVQSCRTARHWKELYVAAPVGSVTVEGYVDLLVDRGDGLVVVDYKTDSVASEADIEHKLEGYAMQGAAYAVAVETATGRPVVDVQFVFARPAGPVVRSVTNLDELRAQIMGLADG